MLTWDFCFGEYPFLVHPKNPPESEFLFRVDFAGFALCASAIYLKASATAACIAATVIICRKPQNATKKIFPCGNHSKCFALRKSMAPENAS